MGINLPTVKCGFDDVVRGLSKNGEDVSQILTGVESARALVTMERQRSYVSRVKEESRKHERERRSTILGGGLEESRRRKYS